MKEIQLTSTSPKPPETRDAEAIRLRERITRRMMKTVVAHELVEAGDRVLVAVSGGKDSYTLLDLLSTAQRKAPVAFDLVAFHLAQGQPGYDAASLPATSP